MSSTTENGHNDPIWSMKWWEILLFSVGIAGVLTFCVFGAWRGGWLGLLALAYLVSLYVMEVHRG